ncbi:MAG: hypothetical protein DYG89_37495 [Caldilinea sp. CFX5]|nr:hypothetical protein [Caldilinea sp. CFX5]
MTTTRFVRFTGLCLIIGALIGLGSGILQALAPAAPSSSAFIFRNNIVILSHLLVLIGVLGFARSGVAGKSWLAKIGLGIALFASLAFIPAEFIIQSRYDLGEMLLGICAPLQGLGMTLTGIAVLRAGIWQGWPRFMPLLCGLYPFLVMIPVFAATGGPNFWAIAGVQVPYLLLGLALYDVVKSHDSLQNSKVGIP